jgi:3-phosphoglycerate kinase
MTKLSSEPVDALLTLDDLEVENQRVLLRVDLNVPLEHGPAESSVRVADDTASAPPW